MRRITRLLLVALLIVSILAFKLRRVLAGSQGNQGLQDGWAINDEGKVHFTDEVAAKIAEAGAGWVRINFRLGGFKNWTETDTFGHSALDAYDQVVQNAHNNNLQVLGLLSNESWPGTQSEWQANNAEMEGGNGDNEYLQAFSQQAAVVLAKHFSGSVTVWEVWNEPNAYTEYSESGGYTGSTFIYPSNFAWLLRHVYEDVDAAGVTDVTFVSGGLFGHDLGGVSTTTVQGVSVMKRGDPVTANYGPEPTRESGPSTTAETEDTSLPESGSEYLQDTYEQGKANARWNAFKAKHGSYPLDDIGQHLYIDQGGTTSGDKIAAYLQDVRDAYVAYEGANTAKETVVTEVGWTTDGVSEEVQAENLEIAYKTFEGTGYLQNAYWFQLRDNEAPNMHYGLVTEEWDQKLSWSAYQTYAGGGGDTDNPPSVSITEPENGATVSGSVSVTADATDDNGVSQVEFFVDAESIGTDSDGSDGWSVDWDSTAVGDGDHTVSATATDTAGQTASASVGVTVDNSDDSGGEGTMHVSAIEMRYSTAGPNYFVYTEVTVVDDAGNPVSDATVYVTTTLPDRSTVSDSDTTDSNGTVTFKVKSRETGTYSSEVTDVTHTSLTYDASANVETSEALTVE